MGQRSRQAKDEASSVYNPFTMSRSPETPLVLCLRAEIQRKRLEAWHRPEEWLRWLALPALLGLRGAGISLAGSTAAFVFLFALGTVLTASRIRALGGGRTVKGFAEEALPKTILKALEDGTYDVRVASEDRAALDRCAALSTSIGATVYEEAVMAGGTRAERARYRTLSRSASALMATAFAALARPLIYRASMGEPEREALRAAERGLTSLRDEADRLRRGPRPRPELPPQTV